MCDGATFCNPLGFRHTWCDDLLGGRMAKTEFLQIRLTSSDRLRVERAANADHLEPSTWARQILLKALDAADNQLERHQATRDGGPNGSTE